MVLRIDRIASGRAGVPYGPAAQEAAARSIERRRGPLWHVHSALSRVFFWALNGYQDANAGDLAAAVAFNALVALVPTFLLCFAVAGLFFHLSDVLSTAIYSSLWGLPPGAASDALDAVLGARRNSGWLGAGSLILFAWVGTSFVSCLARSMNRIYGVPNCGYMCEKRRGFFVILSFALLFMMTLLSSTVPTLFVSQHNLPSYFADSALAKGSIQILGYAVALCAALLLFGLLYLVVPNANQRLADIWPGALTAASLFVMMAQVFPVYLRMIGGTNRYGAAFGLMSLLVAWFYALAHVILFGAYVNSTYQQHRRQAARRKRARAQAT
jgi:membrane protein